jgi:hypothetical protein
LGKPVIFYDISGFLRGGLLPIISMYLNPPNIWFLDDTFKYITTHSTNSKYQHLAVFITF